MWLTILGSVAALLVVLAFIARGAIRALRKYVRSVWPHS
jgi:hypothetical protein